MDAPDVLVLNQKIHGMPASGYRDALQERLPGADIRLATTPSKQRALLPESRVVTGLHLGADDMERAEALALFACVYAGTDHLPMEALAARGVTVTSASGVHAPNAAEQALGYLLFFRRGLDRAFAQTQAGIWQHYQTRELHGSTVAVVGMGPIGTALLERLAPFGVERIGVRHTPSKGGPAERVVGYGDIEEVLPVADALVLACPLTDLTRGLIGERALQLLPPDAILVNIARGPVVDTDALLDALQSNALAAAALDVTDPEPLPPAHGLWQMERCLITPHNAGHTPHYWTRRADLLARTLRHLQNGGAPDALDNRVDAA
jgi:phosphoglycerate dehydrogenase-like enzyme